MKICLTILVSLFAATTSFAAPLSDVLTGSTNANLVLAQDSNDDYKASFNAAFGYDHVYANGLQVGATIGGSFSDDYNTFTALVGPGYNCSPEDIGNSFNADVKVGFVRTNIGNHTETEFAATVQGGKRFKLAESVSYAPGIEVSKIFADNAKDPTITFNIFKFAFLF
ncbi:hypothetical protein SHI21_10540 [Bacteriovorax sp. PP10]|uniref:Outer membrane protein beta-barrel domain-containing protein n=1 Tax=Bacteriovorax antarcticus TaxID=3088717 RepID=A0ABU5VUB1_9BACT|nr:hypothetical protein [Bacteriovorax sp. PP10]MEA9356646.1 hypothetical protein [Bacteriovorax sp. PP10]